MAPPRKVTGGKQWGWRKCEKSVRSFAEIGQQQHTKLGVKAARSIQGYTEKSLDVAGVRNAVVLLRSRCIMHNTTLYSVRSVLVFDENAGPLCITYTHTELNPDHPPRR